jgi:hypothetical protein
MTKLKPCQPRIPCANLEELEKIASGVNPLADQIAEPIAETIAETIAEFSIVNLENDPELAKLVSGIAEFKTDNLDKLTIEIGNGVSFDFDEAWFKENERLLESVRGQPFKQAAILRTSNGDIAAVRFTRDLPTK